MKAINYNIVMLLSNPFFNDLRVSKIKFTIFVYTSLVPGLIVFSQFLHVNVFTNIIV